MCKIVCESKGISVVYFNTINISGVREVYISTYLFNGYSNDYFSQLKSAPESFVTHGVLCSKGMEDIYVTVMNVSVFLTFSLHFI